MILWHHENKGNDHQPKKLWLLCKFSMPVSKEMYREEFGENGYWCQGVRS